MLKRIELKNQFPLRTIYEFSATDSTSTRWRIFHRRSKIQFGCIVFVSELASEIYLQPRRYLKNKVRWGYWK